MLPRHLILLLLLTSLLPAAPCYGDDWINAFDPDALACRNSCAAQFNRGKETERSVDITLTIRIRAFGNRNDFNAAWMREWGKNIVYSNPSAFDGFCVQEDVPELWMMVRESPDGKVIFPTYILGHELMHALERAVPDAVDPDTFLKSIWERGR